MLVICTVLVRCRGASTTLRHMHAAWDRIWLCPLLVVLIARPWHLATLGEARVLYSTDVWKVLGLGIVATFGVISVHAGAIIRLTSSLGCAALLLVTTNKGAVTNLSRLSSGFIIKVLRSLSLLHLRQVFIVIVAFEKLLDAWSIELGLVLNHSLWIGIFPFTVCVFRIEIILVLGRDKRSLHALWYERFPVEIGEPLVVFEHVRAFFAKAISWLALNQFVDEVGSLDWPAWWDVLLVNSYLLLKNVLANFLSIFTMIGPLAKHAFVRNDAHSEVVDCHSMVLTAHYFWCHIAWGAWGVSCVFWVP